MNVDERRRSLYRKLGEVIGPEEAETLREDIQGRGVTRDELREELQSTRDELRREFQLLETGTDAKLSVLGNEIRREMFEMKADLLQQMNEQTKTLYRTIVVSNATMAFVVAGLAFGAARLA